MQRRRAEDRLRLLIVETTHKTMKLVVAHRQALERRAVAREIALRPLLRPLVIHVLERAVALGLFVRVLWIRARAAIRRRARRADLEGFVDNVAACACHAQDCDCRDDFPEDLCSRPSRWPVESFWWGRIPRCRMLEAMRTIAPADILPTRAQWDEIRELATRLCHVPDCRCVELRLGLELGERPPACRRAEAAAELFLPAARPGYRG